MNQIIDFFIRWRTALLGALFALAAALPSLLNAPEVLAVVPDQYRPYVIALGFVLMYLTRPRPATRAADPEVQVKKEIEKTDKPSTIVVQESGAVTAVISA